MSQRSPFGTFGRYTELPLNEMTAEQRDAYDHSMAVRGQVPGPHKIWLQNAGLEKAMCPIGAYFQTEVTLSKAEREIVVNVINGYWAAAAYSNYEHELIGTDAGLSTDQVAGLIAGLPITFDEERQQVVYEVATTLVSGRRLPQGLFDRAIDLIGHPGLTDLTVLIGYFTSVSMSLIAYDVPSNAIGLQR